MKSVNSATLPSTTGRRRRKVRLTSSFGIDTSYAARPLSLVEYFFYQIFDKRGRLLRYGYHDRDRGELFVARYDAQGSLDKTFGGSGIVIVPEPFPGLYTRPAIARFSSFALGKTVPWTRRSAAAGCRSCNRRREASLCGRQLSLRSRESSMPRLVH